MRDEARFSLCKNKQLAMSVQENVQNICSKNNNPNKKNGSTKIKSEKLKTYKGGSLKEEKMVTRAEEQELEGKDVR